MKKRIVCALGSIVCVLILGCWWGWAQSIPYGGHYAAAHELVRIIRTKNVSVIDELSNAPSTTKFLLSLSKEPDGKVQHIITKTDFETTSQWHTIYDFQGVINGQSIDMYVKCNRSGIHALFPQWTLDEVAIVELPQLSETV